MVLVDARADGAVAAAEQRQRGVDVGGAGGDRDVGAVGGVLTQSGDEVGAGRQELEGRHALSEPLAVLDGEGPREDRGRRPGGGRHDLQPSAPVAGSKDRTDDVLHQQRLVARERDPVGQDGARRRRVAERQGEWDVHGVAEANVRTPRGAANAGKMGDDRDGRRCADRRLTPVGLIGADVGSCALRARYAAGVGGRKGRARRVDRRTSGTQRVCPDRAAVRSQGGEPRGGGGEIALRREGAPGAGVEVVSERGDVAGAARIRAARHDRAADRERGVLVAVEGTAVEPRAVVDDGAVVQHEGPA